MSDSPTLRFVPLLVLVLGAGCEPATEGDTTLPRTDATANPPVAEVMGVPDDLASWVEARARALAASEYTPPPDALPPGLDDLDYDTYRSIRFRPEAALWRDQGGFQLQLFHPGGLFEHPVELYVVTDSIRAIPFQRSRFSYDGPAAGLGEEGSAPERAAVARTPGHAGFRVHHPINEPDRFDEFAVFLGASYFRLIGEGQGYGLSARGLAVDVATSDPEEFPDFRAFWLERPAPDADSLVLHALLDSPSVAGAYRFVLAPGASTRVDVDARIFARTDVGKLGVAPLSSMFLFDSSTPRRVDDFRAGVHDSDGLLAWTREGEWIWRPLTNHRGLRVSSLRDIDPRGFGLAQRARDFSDYLDLEARYHERPGAWVAVHPEDRWGPGGVELLEIPTETEYADNIAAYWVPETPFRAGDARRYRYTISTFGERVPEQTLGQVVRTRSGSAATPGGEAPATDAAPRRFAVDFAGGTLDTVAPGASVQVAVEAFSGEVDDVRAEPLPEGSGWRASLRVTPDGERPPDLRLYLTVDGDPVTETWTYVWYPEDTR